MAQLRLLRPSHCKRLSVQCYAIIQQGSYVQAAKYSAQKTRPTFQKSMARNSAQAGTSCMIVEMCRVDCCVRASLLVRLLA